MLTWRVFAEPVTYIYIYIYIYIYYIACREAPLCRLVHLVQLFLCDKPDTTTLLESKRVDVCGHCKKKCTTKGPLSEAIQCGMCYSWVHAACEGLKKEQCKHLTQLTNSTDNIVYYCYLNHCAPLNKKLIQEHLDILRQNNDIPSLRSFQAEQDNLHRIISDVSLKMEDISSQYANLQKQIQDLHF